MNQTNNATIKNIIWSVADDILRDIYVKGKYRDVILPMTVIARIDSELEDTKEDVLVQYNKFKDKVNNVEPILQKATGYSFYNTSEFTLKKLLEDPKNIEANFKQYLNGFSKNIQDILEKFKFYNQIQTLDEADILFDLVQKFSDVSPQLSPKVLNNHDMGYVFEELIRKFNEENNEEAGEHFTPREVIKLMTNLLFLPVADKIKDKPLSIYDPCVGSGGMLSIAKEFIRSEESNIHSTADIFTFGQEISAETYALCKADMLLKGDTGNKVAFGSTLSNDGFSSEKFDFILTNPPYGKSWKTDKAKLTVGSGNKKEIIDPRFTVGTPRINDGQLLFTLHMLSKMKHDTPLGTRIASVHNGSALFTGDAGSGESEIRRHIIENDYLEAIIALPKDMFYNTGIGTYIWILTNRKPENKQGKIQLINATSEDFYTKMTKSLGGKRNEMKQQHIDKVYDIFNSFKDSKYSKIFDNEDFGYHKITVERPLRLSLTLTEYNIDVALNHHDKSFHDFFLTANIFSIEDDWKSERSHLIFKEMLGIKYLTQKDFADDIEKIGLKIGYIHKPTSEKRKKIDNIAKIMFKNFGEEDNEAEVFFEKENPIADTSLRDTENIPLKEDIQEYFEREVLPFAPDAWIKDEEPKVGYEINFNKYFYEYVPPRDLEDIKKDILALDSEVDGVLEDVIKD
jgi:type I restriction enzyme M protein